jgi:hypothetical protein
VEGLISADAFARGGANQTSSRGRFDARQMARLTPRQTLQRPLQHEALVQNSAKPLRTEISTTVLNEIAQLRYHPLARLVGKLRKFIAEKDFAPEPSQ